MNELLTSALAAPADAQRQKVKEPVLVAIDLFEVTFQ
jgi:hypothetical protein